MNPELHQICQDIFNFKIAEIVKHVQYWLSQYWKFLKLHTVSRPTSDETENSFIRGFFETAIALWIMQYLHLVYFYPQKILW